jgi:IS5 family transposase
MDTRSGSMNSKAALFSRYRILDGNPSEEMQWKPSLKAHIKTFQHPPVQASGDRGLSSDPNERLADDLGVRFVVILKREYSSNSRLKYEHKPWFEKGRHWHAGVEGRISVLKRAHGLVRCFKPWGNRFPLLGWLGNHRWNLAVLG